jgi:hypothetical protein
VAQIANREIGVPRALGWHRGKLGRSKQRPYPVILKLRIRPMAVPLCGTAATLLTGTAGAQGESRCGAIHKINGTETSAIPCLKILCAEAFCVEPRAEFCDACEACGWGEAPALVSHWLEGGEDVVADGAQGDADGGTGQDVA